MCIQWVKIKFINSNLRSFKTVYVSATTSIGFEKDVLIWSDLNKRFDCINQFDTENIRIDLIFSKVSEPKYMWPRGAILEGTLL